MLRLFYAALCASFIGGIQSSAVPGAGVLTSDITPREAYITEAEIQRRTLLKRGLPPCGPTWIVPPGVDPPQAVVDDAKYCLSHKCAPYQKGWKHPICGYRYENCVRIGKNVQLVNQGFSIQGRWYGVDGTQLVAFRYWQEQLLLNGPGGSGKVYLAHGSTWTCAKGLMNAYLEDDHYTLAGDSHENRDNDPAWGGPCKCFYKLNTDMEFYLRGQRP